MSYAGTYGADETCSCGHYYRSCSWHSQGYPGATDAQIAANFKRREREREEARQAESRRRAMYDDLNPDERKAAEALWARFLGAYPGLKGQELRDAVRGDHGTKSWVIGRARSICHDAKAAAAALAKK